MSNTIKNFDKKVDQAQHNLEQALFEYISIWKTQLSTKEIQEKTTDFINLLLQIKKEENPETVSLSTLDYYSVEEFDKNYKEVQCTQTDFDSEKKFATYEYIFQRKSDKKYFRLEYQDWGTGQDNLGDENLEEVFLTDLQITKKFT